MRFAITLLVVIALASIIGTIIKQNESYTGYLVEFGPFWFNIFRRLGLFNIYSTGWFVTILGFLVVSTSLCIYRHAPQFVKDMRSFRENATLHSLQNFQHQTTFATTLDLDAQTRIAADFLNTNGFKYKLKDQLHASQPHRLLAAKKGVAQRLGYFFAHAAIILICIGGLLDGNLFIRMQEWFNGKQVETREMRVSQIPARSKLSDSNPTFRGNVTIPEGSSTDVLFLNHKEGYFVQELPFTVTLKKFHVEHYPTGQPKRFASDIVVTLKNSGKQISGTTSVNHPLIVDNIAIYQASFGDGGSPVTLKRWDLDAPSTQTTDLKGVSQSNQPVSVHQQPYTLELGDFRFFNIENFANDKTPARQGMMDEFKGDMENAAKVTKEKTLHNVGPSILYKLRDASGQAREYINYMSPITLEGAPYFISGMKARVIDPYQYFRFPADANGEITGFMSLRALLLDAGKRKLIAEQTAKQALTSTALSETYRLQFIDSAERVLAAFARGGFPELDRQLKINVPQDKRNEVAQIYLKILQTSALEAYKMQHPEHAPTGQEMRFVLDSLVSMSALHEYGSSVYFQLTDFQQVQASGFQISRSPAKKIVYLGCLFLVLGVFAMFYIQEQRIWLACQNGKLLFSMSGTRKNQQFEHAFTRYQAALKQALQSPASPEA